MKTQLPVFMIYTADVASQALSMARNAIDWNVDAFDDVKNNGADAVERSPDPSRQGSTEFLVVCQERLSWITSIRSRLRIEAQLNFTGGVENTMPFSLAVQTVQKKSL